MSQVEHITCLLEPASTAPCVFMSTIYVGIILEYEQAGETRSKCIDLLDLRPE